MLPNVLENITHYESLNAYKIGYLKDERFRFYNPFDLGIMQNIAEFCHLSRNWYFWIFCIHNCRMNTHYYCLMDIPNHPLRVKGLQFLQSNDSKQRNNDTHMEVCTCPKCGNQLYCPVGAVSLKCTCGHVFSVSVYSVCE